MVSRLSCVWVVVLLVALSATARADLAAYVKKKEPDYSWKLKRKNSLALGTVYEIELVSQKWQGIVWKHDLAVFVPNDAKPKATMLIYNTGGNLNDRSTTAGLTIASNVGSPIAFLFGIPNQPLFKDDKNKNGLVEDALIAETFVRYLETKDGDWPLLFPMVKSVVKSMDALQAFAKEEWKFEIKDFVLTGGSKRGWTTWLTATVEPRIKAIAPMVIDTLNMAKQMPYQKESYGDYSASIQDYTKRGLVPMPNTADAKKLWGMVDPWVQRDKLKMPKLILNGTNDPYWTQDALNLYWDDLPGEKWVCYIPNAGHNMTPKGSLLPTQAISTLAAFARCQIEGKTMPKLTWKHDESKEGKLVVNVSSDVEMKGAKLWSADANTRDFRKSEWTSTTLKTSKQTTAEVETPKEGCRVYLVQCEYEMDSLKYTLCTQVRIVGTVKK